MRRLLKIGLLPLAWLIILACQQNDSFPDTSAFELVTTNTFLEDIKPANTIDYLELRRSSGPDADGGESYTVMDSTGIKCNNDSTCLVNLTNLPVQLTGFNSACRPGNCYHYLVTTAGSTVMVWDTVDKLNQLFGEINTRSEAALLVFASGYWFYSSDRTISGTKQNADGTFQVVCTKIIQDCSPLITHLYVLEVAKTGNIKILAEREYSRSPACI